MILILLVLNENKGLASFILKISR